MSFVFDLKYLSQSSINFNMLGVFWYLHNKQISKLSIDLHLEEFEEDIDDLHSWMSCWPPL